MIYSTQVLCQKVPTAGIWQYHYRPNVLTQIEPFGDGVLANGKNALARYYSSSNDFDLYHKVNVLSDFNISKLYDLGIDRGYIVVYSNLTLDYLVNSKNGIKVQPNFDLKNKVFIGAKEVYDVKYIDSLVYIASSMGVVLLDINRNLIRNTYIIGDLGNHSNVKSVAKKGQIFFAISNHQLKYAIDIPANNLQDYRLWSIDNSVSDTPIYLINHSDELLMLTSKRLYRYTDIGWVIDQEANPNITFEKIKRYNQSLYILSQDSTSSQIAKVNGNNLEIVVPFGQKKISDFCILPNQKLFITSGNIQTLEGTEWISKTPSMAPGNDVYRLQYQSDKLIVNSAVITSNAFSTDNYEGYYEYDKSSNWYQNGPWNPIYKDIRANTSNILIGNDKLRAYMMGGVYLEKSDGSAIRFDSTNSTLEGTGANSRVVDMRIDPNTGLVWVLVNLAKSPLKSYDPNKQKWRDHPFSSLNADNEFRGMHIDRSGNKWLLGRNKGVVVYHEKDIDVASDDIIKIITNIKDDECELSVIQPLSIAESVQKSSFSNLTSSIIWIGSSRGIGGVYQCPDDLSLDCGYTIPGQRLVDPNNSQDTTFECAFLNTNVNALTTDPGNRLWVGVSGGGVFYMEEDFSVKYQGISNEYLRFTKQNSPFPSQNVYDILVHPVTGQVFFSTDIGLFSFSGYSTQGLIEEPRFLLTTPNPVPRDYSGLITIDGLPDDSQFKITDVVGNLIYQGITNGGRIVWDGYDLRGIRPPTGVYFVFAAQRGTLQKPLKRVGSFTIIN